MKIKDTKLESFISQNYTLLWRRIQNKEVLTQLDFPQRFGFPVLVILDKNGKRIHTQNSAYLEQDKGYSKEKMLVFLKQWTPAAIDPASYK